MPKENRRVDNRTRVQSIAQRWVTLVTQRARAEQEAIAVIYPSQSTRQGREGNRLIDATTEFAEWQRLDDQWFVRAFQWLYILQWTPFIGLMGGLALIIGFVQAFTRLNIPPIYITLFTILLFLIFMWGVRYLFRVSTWAERLTNNEQELRALFRLTWTTQGLGNDQDSVCAFLFRRYMTDPLGAWFVRETLNRMGRMHLTSR